MSARAIASWWSSPMASACWWMAAASPPSDAVARSQLDVGEDVVAPYLWDRGIRTRRYRRALARARRPQRRPRRPDRRFPSARSVDRRHAGEPGVGGRARQGRRRWARRSCRCARPRSSRSAAPRIEVLAPTRRTTCPTTRRRTTIPWSCAPPSGSAASCSSGDVERGIEQEMLWANAVHPTDVLKVAHHGSRTSSTEEFVSAVQPAFALISAGFENSYGHPHPAVVQRLDRASRHHPTHRPRRPDHHPHRRPAPRGGDLLSGLPASRPTDSSDCRSVPRARVARSSRRSR